MSFYLYVILGRHISIFIITVDFNWGISFGHRTATLTRSRSLCWNMIYRCNHGFHTKIVAVQATLVGLFLRKQVWLRETILVKMKCEFSKSDKNWANRSKKTAPSLYFRVAFNNSPTILTRIVSQSHTCFRNKNRNRPSRLKGDIISTH
jgi:hypothetical protein